MWMILKNLPIRSLNGNGIERGHLQIRVKLFEASFSTKQIYTDIQSFTETYLISYFNLSPKEALSISRKVKFRSADQPDSVIALLKSHEFNDTQILKLIKSCPQVFGCSPSNIILPKLNFFYSLGVSIAELPSFMSSSPNVLTMSLENRIIPFHKFMKTVIGLDDFETAGAIVKASWANNKDSVQTLSSNVALLRKLDVPKSPLVRLIRNHTAVLLRNHDSFKEKVDEVIQIGFDSLKATFCIALQLISQFSKKVLEVKVKTYSKYGWSENDLKMAFKSNPLCMALSEENICRKMEFLVNEFGVKAIDIAKCPTVLLLSMEKRVKPRCLIMKVLMGKGLLEREVAISSILCPRNEVFIERFVSKYEKDVPQLLDILHGKMGISEISRFLGENKKCELPENSLLF
ncbi:uncharacterized protein LOC124909539 [Impatiens glandulifera]|uniref:uncharacterized protein LOC124909539 n=1 Tax=Impatiens glandulifera TaxID=253017 RepID=UPI001FB11441|nr:uncharacterized protein LOC124909539 [Impatiens glandulifera]